MRGGFAQVPQASDQAMDRNSKQAKERETED